MEDRILDPQQWATQVHSDFLKIAGSDNSLLNGATVVSSWAAVERGAPVIHVEYSHPWWSFTTGLRWDLDQRDVDGLERSASLSRRLAQELAYFNVGEPLGSTANSMVPDSAGSGGGETIHSRGTRLAVGRPHEREAAVVCSGTCGSRPWKPDAAATQPDSVSPAA